MLSGMVPVIGSVEKNEITALSLMLRLIGTFIDIGKGKSSETGIVSLSSKHTGIFPSTGILSDRKSVV